MEKESLEKSILGNFDLEKEKIVVQK